MATWAEDIVGSISLGDRRLEERLSVLVETLAEQPEASIPQSCGNWAATLAAYRFFDNAAVVPETLIASLAQATAAQCQAQPCILAVQDTTSLDYSTHRKTTGLGPLDHVHCRGLLMHTTLAVSPDGVPQGVLDLHVWARDPKTVGKRHQRHALPIEAKESAKWLRALQRTEERLGAGVRVVTVADREADVYALFALAHTLRGAWLIRARHDRKLHGAEGRLLAAVERAPVTARLTVEAPRHDKRPGRQAVVEVRSASVVLMPPKRQQAALARWWAAHPEAEHVAPAVLRPLRVGVVLVTEVEAPPGEAPLRWLLLTNLPVEQPEQVLMCVQYYRLRWLVERYHFVFKSGCQVERLQLGDAERLRRALAVYAGVAWRLLWLTHEARVHPEASCLVAFTEEEWRVLAVVTPRLVLLPESVPSLRTVVRQVAALGGFLGRTGDGEPGVKTLWRGLRRLNDMVLTYRALQKHPDLLPREPTCV